MKRATKWGQLFAIVPFSVIVLLFLLLPLVTIITRSFFLADGGMGLGNYVTVFTRTLFRVSIMNSLRISLIATVVGLAVATLCANAIQNATGKVRNFFLTVLNITSNFAGIPLAFAYMILLGNTGVLVLLGRQLGIEFLANFNLYSGSGLTMLYIYFQIPLGTLLLVPAVEAIRPQWREAAKLMRANPLQFWWRVGIPVLIPSILGTFSVLFSNALAAFATAYALLMSNYPLLPINISTLFVGDVRLQPELGSALSVVMMSMMCICVLINSHFSRRARKN